MNVQTGYQASRPRPARLTRGPNQVVAGVCSGIADYMGIDTVIVRVAFAVLTLTTGLGVPIYALGWIMMPEPDRGASPSPAPLAKKTTPVTTASASAPSSRGLYHGLAVGMILVGGLLALRNLNLAIPDALLVPVALAGCGAAVLWARSGDGDRQAFRRWARRLPGKPFQGTSRTPVPIVRLVVGLLLVLLGLGVFVGIQQRGGAVGPILAGMGVTVAGLSLLLGPWIWRMANELTEERRERIRQEERGDIAAHLHDSVLQTLALIQRNADNPKEVGALARRQERELRTWLYGDPSRRQNPTTLAGAMEAMVEEVEHLHQVEVEMIIVGEDGPLDNRLAALVRASREAVVNAAKHSGADEVTVYVEVEPHRATVFVRDRGKGFDPATVPDDRRGIAESIIQRLERRGGRAEVWSAPGEGTEVQLEIPRS